VARGWESKSVEAQQDEKARGGSRATGPASPEEAARVAERRTIELALTRARNDLARAKVAAHRAMLEQAIKALTDRLISLEALE
jgi:hypothetical protein